MNPMLYQRSQATQPVVFLCDPRIFQCGHNATGRRTIYITARFRGEHCRPLSTLANMEGTIPEYASKTLVTRRLW